MAKKTYEGMFLLDSNRYARDPKGVSEKISKMVNKFGGEIIVSRLWSEQKLAFQIKGQRKGTYWLTYFRLEGDEVDRLYREAQLDSNVLRCLIISVDARLVNTLVEHAAGDTTTVEPATSPAKSKDDEKAGKKTAAGEKTVAAADTGPGGTEVT